MNVKLSFIPFLFLLEASKGQKKDCKYKHLSPTHTMCVLPENNCKARNRGVSESDIKVIIDSHNRIRSKTLAANMLRLSWDKELAEIAQRLADQCKFQNDCSDCRTVDRFFVGQNINQWTKKPSNGTTDPDWEKTITVWATPRKQPTSIASFSYSTDYDTYSQVIWAETKYIGCGYVNFQKDLQESKLYVCNYGPAGNIKEDPIYKTGKPCSACPVSTSCVNGLCDD